MAWRLILTPDERVIVDGASFRGPLHFRWRFGTGTIPYGHLLYYGQEDHMLVSADIDATQLTYLESQSDVYVFPEDLDTTPRNQGELNSFISFFEARAIPVDHFQPSDSYRLMGRVVGHTMRFMRRFDGASGNIKLTDIPGLSLNTRVGDLPQNVQDALQVTLDYWNAQSTQADVVFNPNSNLRTFIRDIVRVFEDEPLAMNGIIL